MPADRPETTRPSPSCGAFESAQEYAAEDKKRGKKRGNPWQCAVCPATVESKGCQRGQTKLPPAAGDGRKPANAG